MAKIQVNAKLTSKGQITIPVSARQALGIAEGDLVRFTVLEGGRVELQKEESVDSSDRVVAAYLSFLESDMVKHPSKLVPFDRPESVDDLIAGVDLAGWLDEDQLA
jgi:antitoxin PrlF